MQHKNNFNVISADKIDIESIYIGIKKMKEKYKIHAHNIFININI